MVVTGVISLLVLCVMLMISFGFHFICYMENVEYYVTHMQPHMHGGTFNAKRNTVDLFSFMADRMPSSSYTFQRHCVTVSGPGITPRSHPYTQSG